MRGIGCVALAIALFAALMIATAGTAIYPPVAYPGAALLCGGEVRYESHGASYRPGEYTVTRQIYCQTGGGKGESEEITFRAAGLAFLIYSAILFLLLRFVAAPLMRRRLERTLAAAPAAAASLGQILDRAGEAARGGDDLAERLARLNALRDQGLITAEDYEAKKAEILSRL
ncbi:MAG TPA: SHOCT domain-containing protein [Allosphingosinicella sp.]|nr:SHOCT domain-containing protein [Allosphingosinicella sp.]